MGTHRTLVLYEHSDVVVIAAVTALFTDKSTPSKVPVVVGWWKGGTDR